MLILNLFEDYNKEPEFIQALRDFLPVALKELDLDHVPKIKLKKELKDTHVPTFGRFTNDEQVVYCVINNRHPNDILRTLAHEMAHYAQGCRDELDADSWHTGSPIENQANAQAGVIMREFNKQFPKYMALKPIVFEEWSKKYKDSINCSNPKGFSQKAHCAGRKKHTNEAEQKPKLYTGEELDIRVHLLSKQLGMSTAEVRRQYTDPMIKDGRIKLVPSKVQEDQNKCPPATQDIALNLENRQKAINEYGYGPLNPDLPNTKFWMKKVDEWNLDSADEAKSSLCGNCAAFDQRKDTLDCIAQGIGSEQGADDPTIDAGDLGYCRFLKFKCASRRTCDAWVTGGPLTEGKHCDAKNAVPELKAALEKRKTELKNADAKVAYDKIDKIMSRIAQTYNISGQKLHDLWTERYGEIPDTWVLDENFADGKGPGKPGDSQRHGIPKGATISQLEKASHSAGRKGQLARWQLNMRRGHKK